MYTGVLYSLYILLLPILLKLSKVYLLFTYIYLYKLKSIVYSIQKIASKTPNII